MEASRTGQDPDIVVVMGVDNNGTVTGISVGGSDFAETANLGTRTREPEFTDRFPGLTSTPVMNENVDAISGVTPCAPK